MTWLTTPAHARWLETETDRLLAFGRASVAPSGGFLRLDDVGRPLPGPVELWITCRMTHVYALAHLMGRPGNAALVDHGLAALDGLFRDAEHGGWYAEVDADGTPRDTEKAAYPHAFVVLATSSAAAAGRPGAEALLREALAVSEQRFWDEEAGMAVESWDRTFTHLDGYRGVNANMHTVEAYLAAHGVTGQRVWLDRAVRILTRVVHGYARGNEWRIPEHFDARWEADLEYNADTPAHPFRPYGATIGHWLEWARLTLHARAALTAAGDVAPTWMLDDAVALFDAAVREGWSVDGAPGFVYTVDWSGKPVVRERMHWVAAEAVAAAAALHAATGDQRFDDWYVTWWEYVAEHLLDHEGGSWWHELGTDNRVSRTVWEGKADLYHAVQATLIPRLPLAPVIAPALAQGLLD
ncbi:MULTISPECIES: AGE family epimerase/isomerase [unclassified Cellulomonas]|uniref:AGE family epimerase/isomerase n=1 Tax=unclassified Cellulomonas TaxID=2620175 RepID=UPI0019ADC6D5|nr:AGE family epimerase/isomerase [Cellulomonas sp. ES6]MBD3780149.1 AGE family epimerase/isomerase [Micrococcales bacterium]WHP18612.1 AGE family epimerase/isomerase [Cellulomonas sp. ES6]